LLFAMGEFAVSDACNRKFKNCKYQIKTY